MSKKKKNSISDIVNKHKDCAKKRDCYFDHNLISNKEVVYVPGRPANLKRQNGTSNNGVQYTTLVHKKSLTTNTSNADNTFSFNVTGNVGVLNIINKQISYTVVPADNPNEYKLDRNSHSNFNELKISYEEQNKYFQSSFVKEVINLSNCISSFPLYRFLLASNVEKFMPELRQVTADLGTIEQKYNFRHEVSQGTRHYNKKYIEEEDSVKNCLLSEATALKLNELMSCLVDELIEDPTTFRGYACEFIDLLRHTINVYLKRRQARKDTHTDIQVLIANINGTYLEKTNDLTKIDIYHDSSSLNHIAVEVKKDGCPQAAHAHNTCGILSESEKLLKNGSNFLFHSLAVNFQNNNGSYEVDISLATFIFKKGCKQKPIGLYSDHKENSIVPYWPKPIYSSKTHVMKNMLSQLPVKKKNKIAQLRKSLQTALAPDRPQSANQTSTIKSAGGNRVQTYQKMTLRKRKTDNNSPMPSKRTRSQIK